ncbi:Rab-GTPase-TBC domain [Phytophthora cactorum]|nr:Rab-GTPase-TBC domain [Phytophthora cactorum]
MLAVSDWNEARAFWLLVSILASPRFELERLYGPGLPHLSLRCFQTIDFPISIVATGWFMTLFTNMEALSYDVVVQVFEGFVFKGWKQLFQTALVILEELQGPILASCFDEIPRLFYDIQEYAVSFCYFFSILADAFSLVLVTHYLCTCISFHCVAFLCSLGLLTRNTYSRNQQSTKCLTAF